MNADHAQARRIFLHQPVSPGIPILLIVSAFLSFLSFGVVVEGSRLCNADTAAIRSTPNSLKTNALPDCKPDQPRQEVAFFYTLNLSLAIFYPF